MAYVERRTALRLGCAAVLCGRYQLFGQKDSGYSGKAVRLLEENPVVDLLNQFRFQDFADKPPKIDRWLDHPQSFGAGDAAPYLQSRINVFALGAGPGDYESGLKFFARWNGFLAAHPEILLRIGSVADIASAQGTGVSES